MDSINLPSTSIMITEYCSLKCKLCLAYIPYYENKTHLSFADVKTILRNYFNIVDYVEKFSITGGEPLINPQFKEILKEIISYENKIKEEIILITNGTILFSTDILKLMKTCQKLKVIVNYYGRLSKYGFENKLLLDNYEIHNILYTEDNRYGWIDCRDHSLKHNSVKECEKQAQQCAFFLGKKYVINRGKLFTCTRAAYRIQRNIIPYTNSDFVDLLDNNIEISTQREKIHAMLNSKSTVSCAYCDGLTENSKKFKAAEQLD